MVGKKKLKQQTAELKSDLLEANKATAQERKARLSAENELGKATVRNNHLMYRLSEQERVINDLRRDRDVLGREVARLNEALHRTRASLSSQHLADERKKVFKGAALLRQRIRRLLDENELLRNNIEGLKVTLGMEQAENMHRYNYECELLGKLAVYERFLGALDTEKAEEAEEAEKAEGCDNDDRVLQEEVQDSAEGAGKIRGTDAQGEQRQIRGDQESTDSGDHGTAGAAETREAAGSGIGEGN